MDEKGPPYQRIAAEIRQRISSGELKPGDRVPSTRALVQEFGVAMATATKALAALQQDRLVHPRPGFGTVVGPPPPTHRRTAGPSPQHPGTNSARQPGTSQPRSPQRRSDQGRRAGSALAQSHHSALPAQPPEPQLGREQVVRTAIAIADAEGLGALSMRRIATEMGVSTMALYRHVGGKEALVLQMVDTAVGDFPFPATRPTNWRAGIEQAARLQWSAYRRHLWLPSAISLGRPQMLPNLLPHTDAVLRAVAEFGVDASTAMYAAITVVGYVRGVALNLEPEALAEQDTGMTADEWAGRQTDQLAALVQTGDLPGFRALAVPNGFEFDYDLDQLFEFGLRLVLDGLAARLENSPSRLR
jgi:AcrR family transcriptional regulator